MEMAQKISSMILSIRKERNLEFANHCKNSIPILDTDFKQQIEAVKDII